MFWAKSCRLAQQTVRGASSKPRNHYEVLGVKSKATHAEIKAAYYALSKLYHPDVNQGDEESLSKFRSVSDAYEVLGNVQNRRLYDRGLVVGSSGTTIRKDVDDDDPMTTFHKKRENRHKVPTPLDRSTVYDFDAWTRAHYSRVRTRQGFDKTKYQHTQHVQEEVERMRKANITLLKVIFVFLGVFLFFVEFENHDRPIIKPKTDEKG